MSACTPACIGFIFFLFQLEHSFPYFNIDVPAPSALNQAHGLISTTIFKISFFCRYHSRASQTIFFPMVMLYSCLAGTTTVCAGLAANFFPGLVACFRREYTLQFGIYICLMLLSLITSVCGNTNDNSCGVPVASFQYSANFWRSEAEKPSNLPSHALFSGRTFFQRCYRL